MGKRQMQKNYILLMCLVPAMCLIQPAKSFAFNTSSISIEEVLKGIRMRNELLKNVHVDFRWELYARSTSEPVDVTRSLGEYPLYKIKDLAVDRMGRKMRIKRDTVNINDAQIDKVEHFTWNEKKMMGYTELLREPSSKIMGTVRPEKSSPFELGYWLTPLEQEVFDMRQPLSEIVNKGEWQLSGPELIGLYSAYKLTGKGLWQDKAKLEVWIDPTRDFAPVQIMLHITVQDRGTIIEKMSDISLKQVNGIWIISDAIFSVDNAVLKGGSASRFSVKNYQIGVDLKDDIFEIKFPEGAWVFDQIVQMGYIVGKGVWVTDANGLTEFAQTGGLDTINTPISPKRELSKTKTALREPNLIPPMVNKPADIVSSKTNGFSEEKISFAKIAIAVCVVIGFSYIFYRIKRRN